jgi:hypothetical protein
LTKFHEASFTRDGLYYSLGLGALGFVSDYFSIGIATQNLVRSEKYGSVLPTRFSSGLGFNFQLFRADLDLERNLSNKEWISKSGIEIKPSDTIIFRAGWHQNFTREDKGYSLGSSVSLLDHANLDFGFLDQMNSSIIIVSGGMSIKI